ncbi:MAG: hypothetical protein MJZ25_15795 [Fibrobacter sp.]|nr:hypothetical protein [Fibrobacter sp.]
MSFISRIFSILCLVALAACDMPFSKEGQVVVSVGETKLYESDIRAMAPEWDNWDDRTKLTFLDHWINEETIFQEAQKSGVMDDTLLQSQIQQTVRKMVVDHFLQSFADTMMVGDAERLDYYTSHSELFLRGKTMASGAILYFKEWGNGSTYYRGHKDQVYDSMPNPHYLIKKIETFDSVTVSPDTCILPSITEATVGKITPMKVCGNALKIAVVVSRLDSADVLPYAEVAEDVASRAWVEHQKVVMDRLKKEWKNARPIFSKVNVFSEKDK